MRAYVSSLHYWVLEPDQTSFCPRLCTHSGRAVLPRPPTWGVVGFSHAFRCCSPPIVMTLAHAPRIRPLKESRTRRAGGANADQDETAALSRARLAHQLLQRATDAARRWGLRRSSRTCSDFPPSRLTAVTFHFCGHGSFFSLLESRAVPAQVSFEDSPPIPCALSRE